MADFLGVSNLMEARCYGLGRVRLGELELTALRGDVNANGDVRLTIRQVSTRA